MYRARTCKACNGIVSKSLHDRPSHTLTPARRILSTHTGQCALRILVYLARTPKVGTHFTGKGDGAGVLKAYADSNWTEARSTTGYTIMLANANICAGSRRQHCITMSSCEAELVALADCAIELLYLMGVLTFIGFDISGAVQVYTDNKGAHDLCHRFSSAQNSRHVDRKMFKMRELRGAGTVEVNYVSTELNPADLFTKILGRQVFEKHRATVLNTIAAKFHHVGQGEDERNLKPRPQLSSTSSPERESHPATDATNFNPGEKVTSNAD